MGQKCFSGIAVHAYGVRGTIPTVIGVCLLRRRLLYKEKRQILAYQQMVRGKLGVRKNPSGTTCVIWLGRVADSKEAREVANFLSRIVARVTGQQAITRELRDYASASAALAS